MPTDKKVIPKRILMLCFSEADLDPDAEELTRKNNSLKTMLVKKRLKYNHQKLTLLPNQQMSINQGAALTDLLSAVGIKTSTDQQE